MLEMLLMLLAKGGHGGAWLVAIGTRNRPRAPFFHTHSNYVRETEFLSVLKKRNAKASEVKAFAQSHKL